FAGQGVEGKELEALQAAIEKTVKSNEWQTVLKARGWTDYYAPSDEFKAFIGSETERVHAILTSIGLAN
ncbi:hypothetical protein, partial [Xanthomonas translucens]